MAEHSFRVVGLGRRIDHALNDALHVPMFAALTVLLALLLPRCNRLLVPLLGLGLALSTEALQLLTPRHASWLDVGRDLLGMAPVLVGLTLGQRLSRAGAPVRHFRWLWLGVAVAVVLLTCAGPAWVWFGQA